MNEKMKETWKRIEEKRKEAKKQLEELHGEPIIELWPGEYIQKSLYDNGSWESIKELADEVDRHAFHCHGCGIALFTCDEVTCNCGYEYYCQVCGNKEGTWHSIDEDTGAFLCDGDRCAEGPA